MKVFLKKVSIKIFKPKPEKQQQQKTVLKKFLKKSFFFLYFGMELSAPSPKNFLYLSKKSSFHILDGTF